jgi:hypothetical protein
MTNEAEFLDMYGSKYLAVADLHGGQPRHRIGKTDVVELKDSKTGKDKRRIILYFNGLDKGLVVNKTNAVALAAELGQDRSNWIGVAVELYSVPTQLGEGIRLRPLKPAAAGGDLNDEIPWK